MAYINSVAEKGTYVSLIADYPLTNYTKNLDSRLLSQNQVACISCFNLKTTRTNRNHRKTCFYIVSFYDIETGLS